MNSYIHLPLAGLVANTVLLVYTLFCDPRATLNRIFAAFTASMVLWAVSTLFIFISPDAQTAIRWDRIETVGSSLAAVFLLHFFLTFTRSRLVSMPAFVVVMYLPAVVFLTVHFSSSLITHTMVPTYYGYGLEPGPLYFPFTLYIGAYAVVGTLGCFLFSQRTSNIKERIQARILALGMLVTIVAGATTEMVLPLLHVKVIPLTSTFTTINAIFVTYAMVRYRLMVITPALAADNIIETMADYLVVVDHEKKIVFLSRSVLQTIGHKLEELVGKSLLDVTADPETFEADVFGKLQHTEYVRDHETFLLTEGGSRIPVSVNGSTIKDRMGEIVGFVLIMRDMTETQALMGSLVKASRHAGISEVATGVLHNVGNALSSVNVSSDLVVEKITRMSTLILNKVADLLDQHKDNLGEFLTRDPQGQRIPKLLVHLGQQLAEERSAALAEIVQLNQNVQHIADIIRTQQDYAGLRAVAETVSIRELIEDSVRLNDISAQRRNIRVVCQYANVSRISVDRHKVVQILVNLLRNAVQALEEVEVEQRRITIRTGLSEKGHVQIEVSDNGIGIEKENLLMIFTHGFTTRADGHGFGLHVSALAAMELGGSLTATSDGPGKGATFVLEIPREPGLSERPDRSKGLEYRGKGD